MCALRYLQWENGVSLTLVTRYDAWDDPTAPRIRSISTTGGCGDVVMSSNVTLTGCQGGEILQLYGTHFSSAQFVMAIYPPQADFFRLNDPDQAVCGELTIVSDTYATCVLPVVDDSNSLQYDTPYIMLLWNATRVRSNALFFSIASSDSLVVAPSSSSPSLALLVALPVGLAVLAVLLVLATARQLRNKARSTRRGPSGTEGSGSYAEEKEAEHKQAERGGGGGSWWLARPTLASQDEVRGVELTEA